MTDDGPVPDLLQNELGKYPEKIEDGPLLPFCGHGQIAVDPWPTEPAIMGVAEFPWKFPWEHEDLCIDVTQGHRESLPPVHHSPEQPVIPLPAPPFPIHIPSAADLMAEKYAATHHPSMMPDHLHIAEHDLPRPHDWNPADHPLSPGQLHLGAQQLTGHDLPPPHDWNPAEHPLSPDQLHINTHVDSQLPTPDINGISAPDNQGSIPPPHTDDGTALSYGDTTLTALHSSHATGAEDYSPGTFAADDDISTYGDLGWS